MEKRKIRESTRNRPNEPTQPCCNFWSTRRSRAFLSCVLLCTCTRMMHGGRRSIPRALSPTSTHRILTPAFDGWLTGRQAMRRERSGAFWCHFSPGILAFVPQLHPNCCQPSELSNVPSPTPPIRASELPVRSSAWSAVPVAGLLFRATPRHMQCASGRRRLLRTPLGAHHSTMAR